MRPAAVAPPSPAPPAPTLLKDDRDSPVAAISLAFTGVEAVLKAGKKILINCTGIAKPGHTLALLGSSGSGKTTLLSLLANRPVPFEMRGTVYFNSQKAKASSRRRFCSFVAQETAFMGDFTVRETLRFAALFQLGYQTVTEELLDEVMAKVGLTSCANSRIGSLFFKGISGGQQRRLALAMELLKNPSIIFLDEPLTNLDAAAAYQIVLGLQRLAKMNHTIVFSAHTPSSRVLEAFDDLMVLSRGRCVYFGKASLLIEYLHSIGKTVPSLFNPCDYFTHLLISNSSQLEEDFAKSSHLSDIESEIKTMLFDRHATEAQQTPKKKTIVQSLFPGYSKPPQCDDNDIDEISLNRPSLCSRITTLSHRAALATLRNPGIFLVRLIFFAFLGLFLGAIFFGTCGGTSYSNVRSCISLLMGGTTIYAYLGILSIPFIIEDAHVYAREKHNGAYGSVAFSVTMVLRSIFFTACFALIASLFSVHMGRLESFGLYYLSVFAILLFAESYSIMWSVITRDYLTAILIVMTSMAQQMLLSGFFVVFENIPWVVRWLGYLSPFRYAFRAVLQQEFGTDPNRTLATGTVYATGELTLDFLGVSDEPSYWGSIEILLAFSALCFAAAGVTFERMW